MNPNTIVLITVANRVTTVRNLCESWTGAIRQTINGNYVDIAAGEEFILGWDRSTVIKSLKKDNLGRRKTRGIEVPGGMYMHRAEIPLTTLLHIENSIFLNDLVNSSNPSDKALAGKIIKMAAILSQVTTSHGQFMPIAHAPSPAGYDQNYCQWNCGWAEHKINFMTANFT